MKVHLPSELVVLDERSMDAETIPPGSELTVLAFLDSVSDLLTGQHAPL